MTWEELIEFYLSNKLMFKGQSVLWFDKSLGEYVEADLIHFEDDGKICLTSAE